MAVTPYTTQAKLEQTLSASGVSLRTDDDATNSITQVIADASVEVNGYCQIRYTVAALSASNWIEKKTRDIALFHIAARRANPVPQSIQVKYEKALADLEKVQQGTFPLPDVAERKEAVPVLSNQRVRQSRVPITVVETGRSTGTAEGYTQVVDQVEQFFDYNK